MEPKRSGGSPLLTLLHSLSQQVERSRWPDGGSMFRLGSSNCVARAVRPPTLGSGSPHVFPPCPSKPVKWVLPKRNPVPDMTRLGRSFSQPGESPGPLGEATGLPIEVESTLIPRSYFFPYVPRGLDESGTPWYTVT